MMATSLRDDPSSVIDCHGHLVPRVLVERLRSGPQIPGVTVHERQLANGRDTVALEFPVEGVGRAMPTTLVDTDGIQRWMDEQGVDLQVIGIWADIFGYTLAPDDAAYWNRLMNESVLEESRDNPRFVPLATVPIQSGAHAVAEVEWAATTEFAGITVGASAPGRELDDEDLEGFWAAVADADLPVFIHPMFLADEPRLQGYGVINAVGRPMDTTIAVARLLFSGIVESNPKLRLVLAHGGGAIPYVWGRLVKNHLTDASKPVDPVPGLDRLYFDTVIHDAEALRFVERFAGADHVVLGSDHPFPIGDDRPLEFVDEAFGNDQAVKDAILRTTARDLFLSR